MDKDRRLAFLILKEISSKGTWSNLAVKDALSSQKASSEAFVRELVYGCIRNQKLLDFNIDSSFRSATALKSAAVRFRTTLLLPLT